MLEIKQLVKQIRTTWDSLPMPSVLFEGGDLDPEDRDVIQCVLGVPYDQLKLENSWIEENSPLLGMTSAAAGYYVGSYLLLTLRYIEERQLCWSNSILWLVLFLNSRKSKLEKLPDLNLVKSSLQLLETNLALFPVVEKSMISRIIAKIEKHEEKS